MNTRIKKKIHKRYLADLAIEAIQDKTWLEQLKVLAEGESIDISVANYPEEFKALDPLPEKYQLAYRVTKVALNEVPSSQSAWWQVEADTAYLAFAPSEFAESKFYVAIDFD